MGIKTGGPGGPLQRKQGITTGRNARRTRGIKRGQAEKPFRPIENPFPQKEEFRFGIYQIIEEKDDYLICEGYDPRAKNPFSEITPYAPRTIEVAKPPLLQRTPWDGATVAIHGLSYTYTYDATEMGLRTVNWTDSGGTAQEEDQRIEVPYFVDDILVAVEVKKNSVQDGMVVNDTKVRDENGAILSWVDVNVSGRNWLVDTTDVLLGKTDANISASASGSVSIYTGNVGAETDTGNNLTCYTRTDIDAAIWVNVIERGGGYECFPLECNA